MKFWNLSLLSLMLTACDPPSPLEQRAKAVAEGTDEVFALKNKEAIDEAVMMDRLQIRGELTFIPNTEEPYSGFAKKLFDNDQLEFLIKFKNGYISAVKSWRENGSPQNYIEVNKLAHDVFYFDGRWSDGEFPFIEREEEEDRKIIRKIVFWYENSQKSSVQLFTKEGQFDGKFDYFKNGQQSLQIEMKEDLFWNIKTWKPNGELVEEAVVDGTGKCIGYHDNGILSFKQTFKNGKLNDLAISYHEDGSISSKSSYLEGQLNGDLVVFRQDGSIAYKSTYIDGKPNGDEIFYSENGSIFSKSTYKDGELVESSSK